MKLQNRPTMASVSPILGCPPGAFRVNVPLLSSPAPDHIRQTDCLRSVHNRLVGHLRHEVTELSDDCVLQLSPNGAFTLNAADAHCTAEGQSD